MRILERESLKRSRLNREGLSHGTVAPPFQCARGARGSSRASVPVKSIVTLVAGLVACLASRGHAQQAPASPPTFGSEITLIQVDVSVLDAADEPVRGLLASDFTLFEDGVPRDIQSFTAIDVPAAPPVTATSARQVASDVRDNATAADHRIMVVVLDDLQIPSDMTGRVRELGRHLIEGLSPGDQAAIVFTRINSAAQDFTDDHTRLFAAVGRFAGGLSGADPLSDRDSLGVLEKVSRSLAEIPRRRAAIVFVSVGVSGPRLKGDLFRFAQRSNVNIYPIDPGHLDSLATDTSRQNSLRVLAENTGGLAIIGRNDLRPGVRQVLQDIGSYYLLGYQPSEAKPESKGRKVTVRVNRPGMTVRSRAGYYWARTETQAKTASMSHLDRALGGLLPSPDIRMQVAAAPFAALGRPGATVALVVALTQPAGPEGSRVKEQIDLAVSAYDIYGKAKASKRDGFDLTLRPGPDEVAYEVLSQLDVKPGRYQLRIAAHDMARGKVGSVFYDLEVPDFSKGRVALSGLVLSATPAHPMATPAQLASLLPVVPTTLRAFTTSSRVEVFVRVYQNDKAPSPVALVTNVTNDQGVVVFDATETLAAGRFEAGAADHRVELPVSRLTPGAYLLRLEAKAPNRAAAGRAVPFRIEH
jgi:VWFA-related protein